MGAAAARCRAPETPSRVSGPARESLRPADAAGAPTASALCQRPTTATTQPTTATTQPPPDATLGRLRRRSTQRPRLGGARHASRQRRPPTCHREAAGGTLPGVAGVAPAADEKWQHDLLRAAAASSDAASPDQQRPRADAGLETRWHEAAPPPPRRYAPRNGVLAGARARGRSALMGRQRAAGTGAWGRRPPRRATDRRCGCPHAPPPIER